MVLGTVAINYCIVLNLCMLLGKPMFKECYLLSRDSYWTGFSLQILRIKNIKKNMQR